MKQITRILLDDKAICSKPLLINDSLSSIREIIKEKINTDFLFLDLDGNKIEKEDEKDFALKNISSEKQIKMVSIEENSPSIKIFLNEKMVTSINIEESNNLDESRNIINKKIKEDFLFLDPDENPIEKEDEKDFQIKDIMKQNTIKLKCPITDFPPATLEQIDPTPKTIYKKPKIFKKLEIDFSKYDIIKKETNLTFYRYSKEERKEIYKNVYQYNFDTFDISDENFAYVVLFVGKTGDGKTTALNAFFNIIKGVQLEDEYRFILIEEVQKKKGQAESQTDGVHIYFLKDYNNRPVILIDSQGYGDTRGKQYDEMLNDAFNYVFTSIIDHINTVCFIAKSNTNRLDILTKYIFSSVTSLFSEDISENFIILSTFASKDTITEGPAFIQSIKTEDDFLNIQKRMDEKWWYAFDSKCILDNDTDRLSKYSFSQVQQLYEEKVKGLRPKSIKKCAEVLKTRNELKFQVIQLNQIFENLLIEQRNLEEKNKNIDNVLAEINHIEEKIKKFEEKAKNENPKKLEKQIQELTKELNNKINDLNSQTEKIILPILEKDKDKIYTHCNNCKKNCHEPCNCYEINNYKIINLCKKFPYVFQNCTACGCPKSQHNVDNYRWVTKEVEGKKNNRELIEKERKLIEKKTNELNKEITMKNSSINSLNLRLKELNQTKSTLINEKSKKLDEKNEIKQNINNIQYKIIFILIKLQSSNQKLNAIAMNINHNKREDEYIDYLKEKMESIGIKDEEQEKNLIEIQNKNKTFLQANELDTEKLLNLTDSQLAEKLKIIIPKYKINLT